MGEHQAGVSTGVALAIDGVDDVPALASRIRLHELQNLHIYSIGGRRVELVALITGPAFRLDVVAAAQSLHMSHFLVSPLISCSQQGQ